MSVVVGLLCAAVGVVVGAFLNVVIERVPDRRSLREESAAWFGVPVAPWLLARRADRGSRRRLAVEVVTAAAFGAFGARYEDTTVLLPILVLVTALVAVTFVDLEHLRIPDRITFPALAVAVPVVVLVSVERDATDALKGALVGALTYFAILFAAHLAAPRGMGFGDVKLALLMGLYLGWLAWPVDGSYAPTVQYVLYGLILGCLFGIVFGLAHRSVTGETTGFPFGPALALSCAVVLLWLP